MAASAGLRLLENASATGSAMQWPGGRAVFAVTATFGGGTVKLQMLGPDGSTWIDVADGSLTAAGTKVVEVPVGQVRANVATATAVYASLQRVTA